jgi:hypothetical protein
MYMKKIVKQQDYIGTTNYKLQTPTLNRDLISKNFK